MSTEQRFVNYLVRLAHANNDPAARATLAMLRRGLGKEPGEAPEMYRYVQPRLAAVAEWDEGRYYLVASLFAAHQVNWPETDTPDPRRLNIGASFRQFINAKPESSDSTQRRFEALLECDREECRSTCAMPSASSNLTRFQFIGSSCSGILPYGIERKPVQRRWARAFWDTASRDGDGANEQTNDESNSDQTKEGD
jgi:CRISPR system Cascade subunit CasB